MAWFKKTRKPMETPDKASRVPEGLWVKCPSCSRVIYNKELVAGLGVPMLGSPALLALVIALLVGASLGLGLLISIVSDSERQAVQLSLLVLLASVFFSGFVLPISEFNAPVRVAAHAIPVTSGITLTQDVMLRGAIGAPWQAGLLAAIGLALLVTCWILLRRAMSRA